MELSWASRGVEPWLTRSRGGWNLVEWCLVTRVQVRRVLEGLVSGGVSALLRASVVLSL